MSAWIILLMCTIIRETIHRFLRFIHAYNNERVSNFGSSISDVYSCISAQSHFDMNDISNNGFVWATCIYTNTNIHIYTLTLTYLTNTIVSYGREKRAASGKEDMRQREDTGLHFPISKISSCLHFSFVDIDFYFGNGPSVWWKGFFFVFFFADSNAQKWQNRTFPIWCEL